MADMERLVEAAAEALLHEHLNGWGCENEREARQRQKVTGQARAVARTVFSTPELADALADRERLAEQNRRLTDALNHYWLAYKITCPCGARVEAPRTHPHVPGCPVGRAPAHQSDPT